MTLYMMRGVAGAGKTTRAKELGVLRVNRDTIRAELTGRTDKFRGDSAFESKVTRIETEQVRTALIARKDVVVDATNLVLKYARGWANMANDYGHEFKVIDVRVPLEVALSQNIYRPDAVPSAVIEKHHKTACWDAVVADANHPFVDWTPLEYNPALENWIGCDIDGTLAELAQAFSPYDPQHYPYDGVHRAVYEVLALYDYERVVLLSGREGNEWGRKATEAWLAKHGVLYNAMHMRKPGDTRRDDVVKVEMINEHIRGKYNLLFHLDDRQRVVDGLRAIGITVFQVAPGDF